MVSSIKTVIGAGYGDEGKGLMTDYFCRHSENPIVVCTNGGPQRGHTVVTPEKISHIFHHFGSGTLYGVPTFLDEFYLVNPMTFVKEYNELEPKLKCLGRDIEEIEVYIHPKCKVTTPFDMILNQMVEDARGENRHGSCGCGIWETLNRNGFGYKEFSELSRENKISLLEEIRDKWFKARISFYETSENLKLDKDKWEEIVNSRNLIENFVTDFEFMYSNTFMTESIVDEYDTIVFENGQGLLLDNDQERSDSKCTPSSTGLDNIISFIHKNHLEEVEKEICYVTRWYTTKHGNGQFTLELSADDPIRKFLIGNEKTNIWNQYQGFFRVGILNDDMIFHNNISNMIKKDLAKANINKIGRYNVSISITHLDELSQAEVLFADNPLLNDMKDRYEHFIFDNIVEVFIENEKEKDIIPTIFRYYRSYGPTANDLDLENKD